MPDWLKTAAWIEKARAFRVARVSLVFSLLAVLAVIATSDGLKDFQGRPLGSDFFSFWSAGTMTLAGDAAGAYDAERHYAEHRRLLSEDAPIFFPFLYPPAFLFVAAALAALPYAASWLIFMATTGSAFLLAIRRIAPLSGAIFIAAAFPATFLNFMHGQNGFLVAALFGLSMVLLERRPLVAGVLIGLIAFKPQYGVLIPLALAAAGHWRPFAAAAATVLAQCLVATLAFGPDIWPAFQHNAAAARIAVLESGAIGWEKLQSLFALARALGAPVAVAYAVQAVLALAAACGIFLLWRSKAAHGLKAAGLILAAFIATPYAVDYDLLLVAPAAAFLIAHARTHGFCDYEKAALAFAFVAPILARPFGAALFAPLGFASVLLLFALVLLRARAETRRRPALQPALRPEAVSI